MGHPSKSLAENRKKGSKDDTALVRRTRYAILKALDTVDSLGTPLHELLAQAFVDNPLKFLDTAAKFLPKQMDIDVTHSKSNQNLSDDDLADIIAQRARQRLEGIKAIDGEVIDDSDSANDTKQNSQ